MSTDLGTGLLEQPEATRILADLERLREIAAIDLADLELRRRLDAIAHETRERLGLPTSLITLVLDSAQLIAGSDGLDGWMAEVGGTPVEWSFCVNAVLTGEPYVVQDAAHDPRQFANPLVTEDHIASYCGVPLVSSSGRMLGAHCVLGDQPHDYTLEDVAVLQAAADRIVAVLEDYRGRPLGL